MAKIQPRYDWLKLLTWNLYTSVEMQRFVVGILLCMLHACSAVQIWIPVGQTECFFEEVEAYHRGVAFNYEIIDGEVDEVEVKLLGPQDANVYKHVGEEGRYTHEHEVHGLYKLCISNTQDPTGPVLVGFGFHADLPNVDVLSNADATKIGT